MMPYRDSNSGSPLEKSHWTSPALATKARLLVEMILSLYPVIHHSHLTSGDFTSNYTASACVGGIKFSSKRLKLYTDKAARNARTTPTSLCCKFASMLFWFSIARDMCQVACRITVLGVQNSEASEKSKCGKQYHDCSG